MSERDEIFLQEAPPEQFRFDETVVRVFPDMLRRSIPGYQTLLHLIGVLAGEVVRDGSTVYDLGCSLGAASLACRHAIGTRQARIVALDSSEAMVQRCREVMNADSGLCPVEVRHGDLTQLHFEPSSLVLMNFTLQFVEENKRDEIVQRIADSLAPGGALVISEKTRAEDDETEAQLNGLHDAFRRSNGYSQLELSRKREALERVLVPETSRAHKSRLEAAGLQVTEWFRCLGFVSWVARKPAREART